MDLTDLHAALERHHARDGEGIVCAVCAEWWPCDAVAADYTILAAALRDALLKETTT